MTNLDVMFVSVLLQWDTPWLSVLIYTMFGTTLCHLFNEMKDLFENVASQNIVDFIKETPFYKQL